MQSPKIFSNFSATVRLHLTNVTGAGACRLLESLLPVLESNPSVTIERIELPNQGSLESYKSPNASTAVSVYRRFLPNPISRFIECVWLARRFDGDSPLLVLGDLPLRCIAPQTVFVQNSNLLRPTAISPSAGFFKYWISRNIFNLNKGRVQAFIVQTELMRKELERSYPDVIGRVHVIAQPVPSWLLYSGLRFRDRSFSNQDQLRLIYPAIAYPHKNHALLGRIDKKIDWPVEQLTLTIPPSKNTTSLPPWITCCGFLSPEKMIDAYEKMDALLFLSKEESYGFPLIEAMFIGLPIVCPDLPYARTLCGEQAIYFDPERPESLHSALWELHKRLTNGWRPQWQERLKTMPVDWETVASRMLAVACGRDMELKASTD